jgi:hypothetical protein
VRLGHPSHGDVAEQHRQAIDGGDLPEVHGRRVARQGAGGNS